jgi:hypothetical protein
MTHWKLFGINYLSLEFSGSWKTLSGNFIICTAEIIIMVIELENKLVGLVAKYEYFM